MIAVFHKEGNKYVYVASVKSDDLDVAYKATNHIDDDWWNNEEIADYRPKSRSSHIGDIFMNPAKEGAIEVAPCGFTEIDQDTFSRMTLVWDMENMRRNIVGEW